LNDKIEIRKILFFKKYSKKIVIKKIKTRFDIKNTWKPTSLSYKDSNVRIKVKIKKKKRK
jgi:hypothetical protein